MGRQIRAQIIAPHDLSRNGLVAIISRSTTKVRVVGAFSEFEDGERELAHLAPHVLLLDDVLSPSGDIVDVLHYLRDGYSHLNVIVMSSYLHPYYIQTLLAAGASGFVYREDQLEASLAFGIETVYRGQPYLSPQAASLAIKNAEGAFALNQSDLRVLRLIDQGQTPKDISVTLDLTIRSVYRIRNKLKVAVGAPTHEHLVAAARERGLLSNGQASLAPRDGQYLDDVEQFGERRSDTYPRRS